MPKPILHKLRHSSSGPTARHGLVLLTATLLSLTLSSEILGSVRARTGNSKQEFSTREVNRKMHVLEREIPIKRELRAHQMHSYHIVLSAGQYLHLEVGQRDIYTEVTFFCPTGKELSRLSNYKGTAEPEPISVIAEIAGSYRLDVRLLKRTAHAGRYELKIEELRMATAEDQTRVVATQALVQAELLRGQGTAESTKKAIAKYEESILLSRAGEDRLSEARALNNLGEIYYGLGEKQTALEYFEQVLHLSRTLNDPKAVALAAVRVSEAYTDLGEMQKALDYLETARQLNRSSQDPVTEAAVLTAFGNRYTSLGESDNALNVYRRALKLWRSAGDRRNEANTLAGMAKASQFVDQPHRALGYYEDALQLQQLMGDRRGEAHTLHGIAWTHYTLGNKQKTLDYNAKALSLMKSFGDRWGEAAILTNLGWINELSGERQQALNYYREALPIMQETGDWDGEANTLYRLANVESQLDHLREARAYVQSALVITESLRAKVTNRRLQLSYAVRVRMYHEFYIDLLYRLHKRSPLEGFDAASLEASERARARSLLELLAEANVDIRRGVDKQLIEHERNLQKLITEKTDRRIRVLNSKHTEQQAAEVTRELGELMSFYHDVEAKIRNASPHYSALIQAQTLSLPEIQKLLDADTILLEYTLGDVQSHLWAVTPDSIDVYSLESRSVIESAARRVYQLLTARTKRIAQADTLSIPKTDDEYYRAASDLSRMLLTPVASRLGKKRLVIVSDGALQYIPFAALPELHLSESQSPPVKTTSYNYKPLVLDHEIVNLPSGSTLALLRKHLQSRPSPPKTVAVFADPVFERSDTRVDQKEGMKKRRDVNNSLVVIRDYLSQTGLINKQQPLPRLSYSRKEALAIASLVPESQRKIVLDFDVNYHAITATQLGEYRYLHFATHAWIDTSQPELSGILLSLVDKEGRPQQNGILRLGDIYNLNLPVELVTLSACETALGQSVKGEGMIGLTRGFMYAGVPRVLASLWKVEDIATAELMKLFYEGMLGPKSLSPAAALREAQKQMYEKDREASPFYWAGFVLQGEWR
jgi:CHAT domain-containing protein